MAMTTKPYLYGKQQYLPINAITFTFVKTCIRTNDCIKAELKFSYIYLTR